MINCPDCKSERYTVSANGKKLICLSCYFSFANPEYATSTRGRRPSYTRPIAPVKNPPSYVELWRENKKLKAELHDLKQKLFSVTSAVRDTLAL